MPRGLIAKLPRKLKISQGDPCEKPLRGSPPVQLKINTNFSTPQCPMSQEEVQSQVNLVQHLESETHRLLDKIDGLPTSLLQEFEEARKGLDLARGVLLTTTLPKQESSPSTLSLMLDVANICATKEKSPRPRALSICKGMSSSETLSPWAHALVDSVVRSPPISPQHSAVPNKIASTARKRKAEILIVPSANLGTFLSEQDQDKAVEPILKKSATGSRKGRPLRSLPTLSPGTLFGMQRDWTDSKRYTVDPEQRKLSSFGTTDLLALEKVALRMKSLLMRTSKWERTSGGTHMSNTSVLLSTIIDEIYAPFLNFCDFVTAIRTKLKSKEE
jgi:hypothetical protein